TLTPPTRRSVVKRASCPASLRGRWHIHERHQLGWHDDERAHHVVVFVLEDMAVLHVARAEDGEADDDVDDLVRVDADGLLEAKLVVVELVRDAVTDVARCAGGTLA